MTELPPLIVTLDDRLAWAAYVAYIATEPVAECSVEPNYRDFKNERMVWDAVSKGVMDCFLTTIRTSPWRVPEPVVIEPEDLERHPTWNMRCDNCGRERIEAAKAGSTYCNAPFDVKPHEWNGLHPSHRVTMGQLVDAENAYFVAKNDMRASTYEGRSRIGEKMRIWEALRAKFAKQDAGKT